MENKTEIRRLLLSKREAAAALAVSVRTIENIIGRKELPTRKLGRRTLIPFSALERFARQDHETRPLGHADAE